MFAEKRIREGTETKQKGVVVEMGYILRVRLASFFAGAAVASSLGFYILRRDYKIAYDSISQKVFGFSYLCCEFRELLFLHSIWELHL